MREEKEGGGRRGGRERELLSRLFVPTRSRTRISHTRGPPMHPEKRRRGRRQYFSSPLSPPLSVRACLFPPRITWDDPREKASFPPPPPPLLLLSGADAVRTEESSFYVLLEVASCSTASVLVISERQKANQALYFFCNFVYVKMASSAKERCQCCTTLHFLFSLAMHCA